MQTLLRCVGKYGKKQLQFNIPYKLAFAIGSTNLLICDAGNNRIQEITLGGVFVRAINIVLPWSIAVHGDTIAVGVYRQPGDDVITLLSYATGAVLRSFGPCGPGMYCSTRSNRK